MLSCARCILLSDSYSCVFKLNRLIIENAIARTPAAISRHAEITSALLAYAKAALLGYGRPGACVSDPRRPRAAS